MLRVWIFGMLIQNSQPTAGLVQRTMGLWYRSLAEKLNMSMITITWKRYEKEGKTCDRCGSTGKNLQQAILKLHQCRPDPMIELQEQILNVQQISQSNSIEINGKPLEQLLNVTIGKSSCDSCSDLTKEKTECRTLITDSCTYETITTDHIYTAACKLLRCCD